MDREQAKKNPRWMRTHRNSKGTRLRQGLKGEKIVVVHDPTGFPGAVQSAGTWRDERTDESPTFRPDLSCNGKKAE